MKGPDAKRSYYQDQVFEKIKKLSLEPHYPNFRAIIVAKSHHHHHHHHIYLPSDVISQEKTATSSRSITKASKYAIPLKPNTQNLQSQSDI